eukprot:UN08560
MINFNVMKIMNMSSLPLRHHICGVIDITTDNGKEYCAYTRQKLVKQYTFHLAPRKPQNNGTFYNMTISHYIAIYITIMLVIYQLI